MSKEDIEYELNQTKKMVNHLKQVLSVYQQFVGCLPGDDMDDRLKEIGVLCDNCIYDLDCEHCDDCLKKPRECICVCEDCELNKYDCECDKDETKTDQD